LGSELVSRFLIALLLAVLSALVLLVTVSVAGLDPELGEGWYLVGPAV